MNWLALVFAIVACVIFIATHFGVPRRWATVSLGLFFVTLALIVQFMWQVHQWKIT